MRAKSLPTLYDPIDCSLLGFSIHGMLQASGLPFPPLDSLPDPGIKSASLMSLALADGFLTTVTTWETPFYVE